MDHALNGFDDSAKIVEVDPGRPKSRNRRPNTPLSDCCADDLPPNSSPLPCQAPARISIPEPRKNFHDFDWCLTGDECRFSTAQSTPRFMTSGGIMMPSTPAKSVCGGDVMFRRSYHNLSKDPNYMAKTQSFEAKVRSQSAPKQRPEPAGPKRLSLHDMVEPRSSLSGVRMHRSCSHAQDPFNFKNAVVGRLDRSIELGRGAERDYYLQRRW